MKVIIELFKEPEDEINDLVKILFSMMQNLPNDSGGICLKDFHDFGRQGLVVFYSDPDEGSPHTYTKPDGQFVYNAVSGMYNWTKK